MRTIEALIEAVAGEARRAAFPVDTPAYHKANKDPLSPILFAGALERRPASWGVTWARTR